MIDVDDSWINLSDPQPGLLRLTLDGPPVNALTPERLMGLDAVIAKAEARDDVRAIVLDSACKAFCAGLNLKQAQHYDDAAQGAIVHGLNHGFLRLFECSKPVVVACGGAAIAGGLFFVLAADWRVATDRALFGLAEVRVGVDFPVGPMEIARDTLGPVALRRLIQRGQPVTAQQALDMGIVDEIAEADALLDTALRVAAEYALIPPATYARVKAQVRSATGARIREQMAQARGPWFNDETRAAMAQMLR